MKVWVVKYGETVPFLRPGRRDHYFRSGELVKRLAGRGHEVHWWTGRFEHQSKSHFGDLPATVTVPGSSVTVELLDSPGYSRNISAQRFYDHWVIGQAFRERLRDASPPDLILASYPTLELAEAARAYAATRGIPFVVDVRDMWPDVITERLSARLRVPIPPILLHYNAMARRILGSADSVVAISKPFLDWAQARGKRMDSQKGNDRVFHLAATASPVTSERLGTIAGRWRQRGLVTDGTRRIFCWAGSLTDQAATRALIDAIESLSDEVAAKVQIVVCGKGDLESRLTSIAHTNEHVLFPGFLERDDLQYLYDHASVGLLCYDGTKDFEASFPNKFGEYLMSGLLILTTIRGLMLDRFGRETFFCATRSAASHDIVDAISAAATVPITPQTRLRAQQVFREHFDADTVYDAYLDHLEALAETSPS